MEELNNKTSFILNWWNELTEANQEKWIFFFIDNLKPIKESLTENPHHYKSIDKSTRVFITEKLRMNKIRNFEKKCEEFFNDPEFYEKYGYLISKKYNSNHHTNHRL